LLLTPPRELAFRAPRAARNAHTWMMMKNEERRKKKINVLFVVKHHNAIVSNVVMIHVNNLMIH